VERTLRLLAQRQTPLVAQPSQHRIATARDPPHVPHHGVIGGGTVIVSVEQDGVWIGRHIVPTFGGALEIIVSPIFDEEGFDPGEEASLRIPEINQHSKECFVSGRVPHPRNLISYPLYRQMSADVTVAAQAVHGRACTV
jgi:hypothetical protein